MTKFLATVLLTGAMLLPNISWAHSKTVTVSWTHPDISTTAHFGISTGTETNPRQSLCKIALPGNPPITNTCGTGVATLNGGIYTATVPLTHMDSPTDSPSRNHTKVSVNSYNVDGVATASEVVDIQLPPPPAPPAAAATVVQAVSSDFEAE